MEDNGVFVLAGINLWLTVIIFIFIPVMVISCTYFNTRLKRAFMRQRNQIGELNARIEDNLLGNRVVLAFANQDVELEKFRGELFVCLPVPGIKTIIACYLENFFRYVLRGF